MRRRCGGVREEEGAAGERNNRVARTPKLVCHSVRQSAYSQAQTQVAFSICANESIYIYTHSLSRCRKLEISLFIPLPHSNQIPPPQQCFFSTFVSLFLTSLTLYQSSPSGCFPGNNCFLFVCLGCYGGRVRVMLVAEGNSPHSGPEMDISLSVNDFRT